MANQSVQTSDLLSILNTTNLQKENQRLYDFLRRLLFSTGQISSAVGTSSSSSSGGGGTTNNTYNITNNPVVSFYEEIFDEIPGFGPPGSPGGTGASGAAGTPGVTSILMIREDGDPGESFPIPGPIGPAGINGTIGRDGISIPGIDGIDGEDGFHIPGPQGIQGIQGLAGLVGPVIFPDDGEPGLDGFPGARGIDGTTGASGAVGPIGPAVYLVEEINADDPMPIPGGQGPTGNPGSTGNTGSPGQLQAVFLDDWAYQDEAIQTGYDNRLVVPGIVLDNPGSLTITNSGSEQTLYTFALPGGAMGTTQSIRFVAICDYLNNIGASTITFRLKYGATTLYAGTTGGVTATTQHHGFYVNANLGNVSSTNAQYLMWNWVMTNTTAPATGLGSMTAGAVADGWGAGSSSVDSTVVQNFAVTVQHSTTSTTVVLVREFASLLLI